MRKSSAFPTWSLNSCAAAPPLSKNVPNLKSNTCSLFDFSRPQPPSGLSKQQTKRSSLRRSKRSEDSAGILIFAYVIMPDHIHLITGGRSISESLRFTNGITAKRVIDYLKENNFESSLTKLRIEVRERKHKHSLFQHHPNAFEIYGEDTMIQEVNYVHLNPVRAGLVEHQDDYLYSSARQWHGKATENEPLITDHHLIKWRSAA